MGYRAFRCEALVIQRQRSRLIDIAIGNQYTDLAQILLAVHDPSLPTVGPLRRRLIQDADVSGWHA
jgi:hypothetical protein